MRAINHAITGAIIGFVVGEPLIAVPAAVASHFVMDAIPHHGLDMSDKSKIIRSKSFKFLLYFDAIACIAFVFLVASFHPMNWLLACICAFAAAAPDFLSFNRYRKTISHKKWRGGSYAKFASGIQWFERPIGAVVEIAWFLAAVIVIVPFLK